MGEAKEMSLDELIVAHVSDEHIKELMLSKYNNDMEFIVTQQEELSKLQRENYKLKRAVVNIAIAMETIDAKD